MQAQTNTPEILYFNRSDEEQIAASLQIESLNTGLYLPNLSSQYGCTTATATFMCRLLGLNKTLSAIDMDQIVGRVPDEPANTEAVKLALLREGARIVEYHSDFTRDWYLPYLSGEISFEEQDAAFFAITGVDEDEETTAFVKSYQEEVVKPQHALVQQDLRPYIDNGQYVDDRTAKLSEELFLQQLSEGAIVQANCEWDSGNVHTMAFWRPTLEMPALYFTPEFADHGGSFIAPLEQGNIDEINFLTQSILAITK